MDFHNTVHPKILLFIYIPGFLMSLLHPLLLLLWVWYAFDRKAFLFVILSRKVFDDMLLTLCVCKIVERGNRWGTLACHTTIRNSCDASWSTDSCIMTKDFWDFSHIAVADLGGREGAPPPWAPKFFQFHAVFRKIWQNHMLATPWGFAPPPLGSWRPPGEILDPPLHSSNVLNVTGYSYTYVIRGFHKLFTIQEWQCWQFCFGSTTGKELNEWILQP